MTDAFDNGDGTGAVVPASLRELTGYELWEHTQQVGEQLGAAYERMTAAGSPQARTAVAPDFLRLMRQLLTVRLVAVAGDRRQAFQQRVPPAGSDSVAALWAEVFWAARAEQPDDDSGVLERTAASIRGLLDLKPDDLADPDTVRACWERLQQAEETFGGLEMEAQVTLEGLQEAYEYEQQTRQEMY